jgi:hypothetical protein
MMIGSPGKIVLSFDAHSIPDMSGSRRSMITASGRTSGRRSKACAAV